MRNVPLPPLQSLIARGWGKQVCLQPITKWRFGLLVWNCGIHQFAINPFIGVVFGSPAFGSPAIGYFNGFSPQVQLELEIGQAPWLLTWWLSSLEQDHGPKFLFPINPTDLEGLVFFNFDYIYNFLWAHGWSIPLAVPHTDTSTLGSRDSPAWPVCAFS